MSLCGKRESGKKFRVEGVTWHISKGSSGGTPTVGACSTSAQFSKVAHQVQLACCSAGAQCLSGLPTVCVPRCQAVVRPFLNACAPMLSGADPQVHTLTQAVQHLCSGGGH
jgi:hypothetical protein